MAKAKELSCSWCNKIYKTYYVPKGDKYFCCPEHRRLERNSRIKTVYCKHCDNLIPFNSNQGVDYHNSRSYCSEECFAKHTKRTEEEEKARSRKRSQRRRDNLSGAYIRRLLKAQLEVNTTKEISEKLVQVKRFQLMAKRQAKDKLKITKQLCQNANLQQMI